jgi:hypothetical protein
MGWENGQYDWSNLWGVFTIWTLFLLGYNSLERETNIKLTKAKEEMNYDETQLGN